MCQISNQGSLGVPFNGNLSTSMEQCQRTGVFINGSSDVVTIRTGGIHFVIPAGMVATVPVAQDIWIEAQGKGSLLWTVTDAVLPAQLAPAPAVAQQTKVAEVRTVRFPTPGTLVLKSQPSKLIFIREGF